MTSENRCRCPDCNTNDATIEHPEITMGRELVAAIEGASIVGHLEFERGHDNGMGGAAVVYRIPDDVQAARNDAGLPPHHLAMKFNPRHRVHTIGITMARKGGKAIDGWVAVDVTLHTDGRIAPASFRRAYVRNHPSDLSRAV